MANPTDTITVCEACQQASCRVKFPCSQHRTAGLVEMTVAELTELDRESPKFWDAQLAARRCREAQRHYAVSMSEVADPAKAMREAGFVWLLAHSRAPLSVQFYYCDGGPKNVPAWAVPCELPPYKEKEVAAKLGVGLEQVMVKRYGP